MIGKRLISKLRAAHGLSFAMATGQRLVTADLEDVGWDGVDGERFDVLFEHREAPHREELKAAAEDAPVPGAAREPQIGLVGLLAPKEAPN